MPASQSRLIPALLPGRPLLSLGLLQLVLGCSMVALSFGALSLSSSPPIRNSCPFWAGSSVIVSGIIGLTTWRRPMLLLVNLFVLLSVVCVLLNLAGFILCCQGAQLVSGKPHCQLSEMGDVCLCCADGFSSGCSDEKMFKLNPGNSCEAMRILLKKVLFALCALNALTTAVCMVAAALRYLQIFAARRPCAQDEPRSAAEEGEDTANVPDPDEFVPPAPPPSYFSTFYSYTPRLARRMFGDSVIPLPHIYGARIKGVEVFCPLDPPPPYEAIAGESENTSSQTEVQMTIVTEGLNESCDPQTTRAGSWDSLQPIPGSTENKAGVWKGSGQDCSPSQDTHRHPPGGSHTPTPPQVQRRPVQALLLASRDPFRQHVRRSNSDPILLDLTAKVLSCEAATQTDGRPDVATVTLRRGLAHRKPRPSSMVDYQSYQDTKQLVTRFLEHSSSSLTPEVQELVNSIKTVLRSDQEHMEEAVRSASFIDQVMMTDPPGPPAQPVQPLQPAQPVQPAQLQPTVASQTLPLRKRPALLHLRSCGDLSTFTKEEPPSEERKAGSRKSSRASSRAGSRAGSRAEHERPHSLIGVFRETVL